MQLTNHNPNTQNSYSFSREPYRTNIALHSSFMLAKSQILPMDLVAVDTVTGRLYSFLSVTWGLIADVDIESERYRSLGGARFTIGAMARMISEFVGSWKVDLAVVKSFWVDNGSLSSFGS